MQKVDFIIAMHPDEATEMVVDLALKYNKNFAVVPCCVFPNLYHFILLLVLLLIVFMVRFF